MIFKYNNNILLAVIIYLSVVNIAFTVTPISAPGSAAPGSAAPGSAAPGSAALLTLFRLSGTHRCCPTWGARFSSYSFDGKCVPMQRCTLRLSVLWRYPIGSLFLSTYTTLHTLFGFLPVHCVHCCGFRDCGTPQRSTLCL